MTRWTLRSVAILFLALGGCDGYARLLYLKPPDAPKPPWSVAAVVMPIRGDEDIVGIVSSVAAGLNLGRYTASADTWYAPHTGGSGSFRMTVTKEPEGYWTIVLLDWPSFTRSDISVRAERAIRTALKQARVTGTAYGRERRTAFVTQ